MSIGVNRPLILFHQAIPVILAVTFKALAIDFTKNLAIWKVIWHDLKKLAEV